MAEVNDAGKRSLVGIEGWLIIPAIICVVAPLTHMYGGIEGFVSADKVSSRVRSIIYLDAMLAFILAAAWAFCGYLMTKRHRRFPHVFISLMVAGLCKLLLAVFLLAVQGVNIGPLGADFGQAFLPAIIWIPYMLLSSRVKQTFTHE